MKTLRRLSIAVLFALGLSNAVAQAPPVVPALPDTPRLTSYTIAGTTCACAVNFALYGNGNLADYQDWVEVFLNGVQVAYNDPTYGWTITSPTGALASIARPITNSVLTFTNVQTGTVQIVGAARPSRLSQWSENQGVSARNLNVAFTGLVAQLREVWDKINDVSGRDLKSQPGNTVGLLPLPATCSNKVLGFDVTGLNPICTAVAVWTPGGSSGQTQWNNGGVFAGYTMSGDATLVASTGALTLGSVNSNIGAFGSSTAIPALTVNAKGLVTAVTTNAIIAPAGTLTGTTLSSNIVASSLTSVGTLAGLAVSGTAALTNATISGATTFSAITGSTQCLHVNASGVVSGVGSDCGSGGGGGSGGFYVQPVTPTSTNTFPSLSNSYTTGSTGLAVLVVNGVSYTDHDASPVFSVSLSAITWNATNAGFSVGTADTATIYYTSLTGAGGSVTNVSVVSANGLAGTVATASTTPAITLSTTITGLLKGNGTAISAATAGTDYLTPSGNGSALTGIVWSQIGSTPSTLAGYGVSSVPASAMPALTGDVTTSAGSVATTIGTIGGQSVSLAGSFSLSGAYSFVGKLTGATSVTFPTSGTLATTSQLTGGTVTSVGQTFTGGLLSLTGSPITASGTFAWTVAGTSGGVPYFSSSSAWASSGVLTSGMPVLGGGAGGAPTTGTLSGNTTTLVTTTGSLTATHCVDIDGNGNFVDSGGGCASVNTATVGNVAYYSGASVLSGESMSALLDASIGSTQGDVLYRGATTWAVLAPGISGYFFETQGASANPTWAPASGGTGCVTGGFNTNILTSNGSGGCTTDTNTALVNGALALGSSGILGSVQMGNGTSGTITLQPTSGALGSITEYLPIASGDTLVALAATQTLTNKSIAGSEVNSGTVNAAYLAVISLSTIGSNGGVTGTLPAANGGTNCSVASITCFNNITGFTANGTTGTTSTSLVFSTSPTLVTPVLGVATATSLAIGGATIGSNGLAVTGTVAISSTLGSAADTITSASATALAVGLNGATNPAFVVDASTASQAAGLSVKGAATGGTVALVAIDSGSNTNLTINAKGTGTIGIGSVSTGAVTITPATTITGALTLTGGLNTPLIGTYGGTGINNGSNTLTLGGSLTTTGAATPTLAFGAGSYTYTFAAAANDTVALLGKPAQAQSGGVELTSYSIGTKSSGTYQVDCGNNPHQYLLNGGAFTISAPANDGNCFVQVVNGSGAGAVSLSGFATSPTGSGDTFATTATVASAAVTVTSASPAVITYTNTFVPGQPVYFTASVMPTGMTANTIYYVGSTGLTTAQFEIATTAAAATSGGTMVNTSSTGTTVVVDVPSVWALQVFRINGLTTAQWKQQQ
jgi:hypothetical protein